MQELENKLRQDEITDISSEQWDVIYNNANLLELFLRRVREGVVFDVEDLNEEIMAILFSKDYIASFLNCFKKISPSEYLDIFAQLSENADSLGLEPSTAEEVFKYYNDNKEEIFNLFIENISSIKKVSNIDFINEIIKRNLGEYAGIIEISNPTSEIEDFIINNLNKINGIIGTYSKRIEEACVEKERASSLAPFYKRSENITNALLKELENVDEELIPYRFLKDNEDRIEVIKYKIANDKYIEISNELIAEHPELEDFVTDLIKKKKIRAYMVRHCYDYPKIMLAVFENLYSIEEIKNELHSNWDGKLSVTFDKDPKMFLDTLERILDNNISETLDILTTIAYNEEYQKFERIIKKAVSYLTFEQIVNVLNEYYVTPLKRVLNEYSDYYNYSVSSLPDSFNTGRKYNERILLSAIPLLSAEQLDNSKLDNAYYNSEALLEAIMERLAELKSDKFNNYYNLFSSKMTPKMRDIVLRSDNPLNLSVSQIKGFLSYDSNSLGNDTIEEIINRKSSLSSEDFAAVYSLLVRSNLDEKTINVISTLLKKNIEIDERVYNVIFNTLKFTDGNKDLTQVKTLLREFLLNQRKVPLKLTQMFDAEVRKQSTYDVDDLSKEPDLYSSQFTMPADFKEFVLEAVRSKKPVDLAILYNLIKADKDNRKLLEYDNFTYNSVDTIFTINELLSKVKPGSYEETCLLNWLHKTDINELFRVHYDIIAKMYRNEKLFSELIKMSEGKDLVHKSDLIHTLTNTYSDEFNAVVKDFVEKAITSSHVDSALMKISKELVELDNPVLEKFLIDNYFKSSHSFSWLTSEDGIYLAVKNKSIYFDALMDNIKNNKHILDNHLTALHRRPELVELYIEGIQNGELDFPYILSEVHFDIRVIKLLLEKNPSFVTKYVELIAHEVGRTEWLDEETFGILLDYAATHYGFNKESFKELVNVYGYELISLIENEQVNTLFKQDINTIKKFLELFKVRQLDVKAIEAINDSIQQKLFGENFDKIGIFTDILAAIQNGISEEEINNYMNILCEKDENGKYHYMTDKLVIRDCELTQLYENNRELFLRKLITLVAENPKKYGPVLKMVTATYKDNPNLYESVLAAIQRGITENEINDLINTLCKKDENDEYLYLTNDLIIIDYELNELYQTMPREEFFKYLIALITENQNKYAFVLSMFTGNYISEKRNEVTQNEDIYRDTNVGFHYDQRQLYDAYFNFFRDKFSEEFFLEKLAKGYEKGYPADQRIDELTIKFLYDPSSIQVSKDDLILIKKNIRSIKERLGNLYFCYIEPEDIDQSYLQNVKKIFDFEKRRITIDDFGKMNVGAILNIIGDKEQYNKLVELLEKYKFLDWGEIFNESIQRLKMFNKGEETISIEELELFNFINAFSTIYDAEVDLAKDKDVTFNGFKIVSYGLMCSSIPNGYKVLFGIEDFDIIRQNQEPNKSQAGPLSRLDYDGELLIRMLQADAVTIPSFVKEYEVSDNKKLRVLVGCKGDTRNLTVGERTGACLRAYGAAHGLFTFSNTDPRGFNMIFEDPETGKFISRVTGFRNGNTVFFNELRSSVDGELFSNHDVIKACREAAREIIELSKESDMPIENVVVSPDITLANEKIEVLSEPNIGEGVYTGYKNVSDHAVVLATVDLEGRPTKLRLDGQNQPVYRPCRLPIREYKYPNIDNGIKILIQRVNLLQQAIEKNDVYYAKTVDFDFEILDNEYAYVIIGQDFYVAMDTKGNITNNIAVISDESQREYQEAIEKMEGIKNSLTGGIQNEDGQQK